MRTGLIGLLRSVLLCGCGSETSTDTAPEVVLEPWEQVCGGFGLLKTVAGTGLIPDKGVSGWDEAFEGGQRSKPSCLGPI